MTTEEFIEWVKKHKNPEKIPGMEKYMRNQFKFLGLQATERRKLANIFVNEKVWETKELSKKMPSNESVVNWSLLFTLWEQPEREFQLIGIDYLKKVQDFLVIDDLLNLRKLVLSKSWWDTVDFLSKNIGAIVAKEPVLIDIMKEWSLEENIWIRRVSILHQLSLKERTHTGLLKEVLLNNIDDEEFFIRKAIGWALREYAKTNGPWVRDFVGKYKNQLSPLSYREAIKNIKEG